MLTPLDKRLLIVAGLAIALMVGIAIGEWESGNSANYKAEKQTDSAANREHDEEGVETDWRVGFWYKTFRDPSVSWTFYTVVLGIVGFAFLYVQLRETQKGSALAKQSTDHFIESERGMIRFVDAALHKNATTGEYNAYFTFENVGNTVATIWKIHRDFKVRHNHPDKDTFTEVVKGPRTSFYHVLRPGALLTIGSYQSGKEGVRRVETIGGFDTKVPPEVMIGFGDHSILGVIYALVYSTSFGAKYAMTQVVHHKAGNTVSLDPDGFHEIAMPYKPKPL